MGTKMKNFFTCSVLIAMSFSIPIMSFAKADVSEPIEDVVIKSISSFNNKCLYDYALDPTSLSDKNVPGLIKVLYRKTDKVKFKKIDNNGEVKDVVNIDNILNIYKYDKGDAGGKNLYFAGDLENKSLYRDLSAATKQVELIKNINPSIYFSNIMNNNENVDYGSYFGDEFKIQDFLVDVPYVIDGAGTIDNRLSISIESDCNRAANSSLKSDSNISFLFMELKYLIDSLYSNKNQRRLEIEGVTFRSRASELGILEGVMAPEPDKIDLNMYYSLWRYYTKDNQSGVSSISEAYIFTSFNGLYINDYVAGEVSSKLDVDLKTKIGAGSHEMGVGGASYLKGVNKFKDENQKLYFIKGGKQNKHKLISASVLSDRIENAIVVYELASDPVVVSDDGREVERLYGIEGIPNQYCSSDYFVINSTASPAIEGFFKDFRFRLSRDDKRFSCVVVIRDTNISKSSINGKSTEFSFDLESKIKVQKEQSAPTETISIKKKLGKMTVKVP
jgi:hypothetical protein